MLMLFMLLQAVLMNFSLGAMERNNDKENGKYWQDFCASEPKLHQLIRKDADIQKIEDLIRVDGSVVNAPNKNGTTPVNLAAKLGKKSVVKLLHSYGADMNKEANDGGTPLHAAILLGKLSVVKLLWRLGADVNYATSSSIHTPLYCAVHHFVIRENRKKLMPIIAFLLEKKANIDQQNMYQDTPLTYAQQYDYKEIIDLFASYQLKIKYDAMQIIPYMISAKQIIPYVSAQEILFPESK